MNETTKNEFKKKIDKREMKIMTDDEDGESFYELKKLVWIANLFVFFVFSVDCGLGHCWRLC